MSEVRIGKLEVTLEPVENLIPYENNAKRHPPEQVAKIAASMREHGWVSDPIEITPEKVIINGHGRLLAAKQLGLKRVPVVVRADLSPEQARKYRIDHNQVGVSDWDTDLLMREIREVHDLGFDFSSTFDPKELQFALEDMGEIDVNALTKNLGAQVTAQADDTQKRMEEEDKAQHPIAKAIGFSKITTEQKRKLTHFLGHIEALTGKKGAEAFFAFIDRGVA